MAIQFPPQYPIVTPTTTGIIIGTVCYMQKETEGTALGLLLALTRTPVYKKVILTSNGFRGIE